jgi:hypothetical protein
MKGTRQRYIQHVVRRITNYANDFEKYMLLPDAEERVEETFYKLRNYLEILYNQTKPND